MAVDEIIYSDKYYDEVFEYRYLHLIFCFRHVTLPKEVAEKVCKDHLMTETEWRNLGVQQSRGWVHF